MPKASISTTVPVGDARLQLLRRALGDDPAVGDHGDPVAQRVGLEHVVRGQQHRLAGAGEPAIVRAQLARAHRVDADRRLVEEDHRRVVEQAAGDVQPLAHAARVALDALVLAARQADQLEQLVDPPPLVAGRRRRRARRSSAGCRARRAARTGRCRRRTRSRSGGAPRGRRSTTSIPSTRVPLVGRSSVISILIVVVLPAPFGPSRPNSSPWPTSNDTPRTPSPRSTDDAAGRCSYGMYDEDRVR